MNPVTADPGALRVDTRVFRNPPGIGLRALIREDLATHDGNWHAPGFRTLAVHRFGNWRMALEPKLLRAPFSIIYRRMYRRVCRRYGIELEFCVQVGRRVQIAHQSGIVISGWSAIGDDCIIRQNTTLGIRSLDEPTQAPTLGCGVDVGAGAVLLGGVTVGDRAVIGANAVVLMDVPPGALAVGVPARIVRRTS